MVLKFKNRAENPKKKILIYGLDGSGKSCFAAKYCKENGLKPVCIDIDDTNFTSIPILDLNFGSDVITYNSMKKAIEEISKSEDFDTIIIDGVTSLLEMLTSKAKGMAAYSDRSKRWNDLLFQLNKSKKNVIFIGQIDMEMLFNEDYQPSKAVIKVNSLVNEKYKCYITDKGDYEVEVKKFRTLEQIEAEIHSAPKTPEFKSAKEYEYRKSKARTNAERLLNEVEGEGQEVNLANAKKMLVAKILEDKFTTAEANEIWAEIEVLLNGT